MHEEKNVMALEEKDEEEDEEEKEERKDKLSPLNDEQQQLNQSIELYENDFDLYNLLKDMVIDNSNLNRNNINYNNDQNKITSKYIKRLPSLNTKLSKPNRTFQRKQHQYKNYTKSLTARLLDSHYTNGKSEWCLIENGIDYYRSKVKCIGTDLDDCDLSDIVYLDLQPLSTRIKLMCKLIIIIQGACLERCGPPKLVQDRCVQFDATNLDPNNSLTHKVKSNSLENLLKEDEQIMNETSESDEIELQQRSTTKRSEIKISIYGKGSRSSIPISINIRRKNSSKRSARPVIKVNSNNNNNGAVSDDEILHSTSNNDCNQKSKSNDLEHYFKYRNYSFRDYASTPYYQYSVCKEMQFSNKSTNTDQLNNTTINAQNQTKSTSTDDLMNTSSVGFFSKHQLLSSKSLFEKKSSLIDSFTSIDKDDLNYMKLIPINIPLTNKKVVKTVYNSGNKNNDNNNNSDLFNSNEENEKLSKLITTRPKKSSEWSLYKKRENNRNTSGKLLTKTTTTTTTTRTTTTTTTTTKTTKVVELIENDNENESETREDEHSSAAECLNDESFTSQTNSSSLINDVNNEDQTVSSENNESKKFD